MKMHIRIIIALAIRIIIALAIGFVIAMLLMSVKIYFGFTNAYSTNVNALTVKILGIPMNLFILLLCIRKVNDILLSYLILRETFFLSVLW